MTFIGIIGGYGLTGRVVAAELAKQPNVTLLIAGRDEARIHQAVRELGETGKPYRLDLTRPAELDEFCKQCDIVINCAGPSIAFSKEVALAALKNDCHYIDPGGYELLREALMERRRDIENQGRYFVISCGWIPGISEVFVHYAHRLADERMDSLERLDHFYGDRNEWSDSGLKDIIWHLCRSNTEGTGMGIYQQGKWRPLKLKQSAQALTLPAPFGQQKAYSNFPSELKRFAQENAEYQSCHSGSIQIGRPTLFAMLKIRAFFKHNEEKAVQVLKKAHAKECQTSRRGGGVVITIKGEKAGKSVSLTGSFFANRPYWLTGIAPVITAKLIIGRQMKSRGCNYLCDAVDAPAFMDLLAKAGLKYQFYWNDSLIAPQGETL
jgi:saccharopine dehydrogenase (NAD+, L-lysine-forming)